MVSGGAELLLGMGIIGKLDITVGFGERKVQIGQGEWRAVTRNKKNRWVSPPPTARGREKTGRIFPGNENGDLEVSTIRADFDGNLRSLEKFRALGKYGERVE